MIRWLWCQAAHRRHWKWSETKVPGFYVYLRKCPRCGFTWGRKLEVDRKWICEHPNQLPPDPATHLSAGMAAPVIAAG